MNREMEDDQNDADVIYAALWQAAPFPRLPQDAPPELRKLTIDIEDPKRVYAIHRAARRHNFQILVERYIIQIRYGCQSSDCNTSTCFSSRLRCAAVAGAPVRRYNATSARTLAIHLASQDNPEQGLCQHISTSLPLSQRKVPDAASSPPAEATIITRNSTKSKRGTKPSLDVPEDDQPKYPKGELHDIMSHPLYDPKDFHRATSLFKYLQRPPRIDHLSFVQNVFTTTAVKMLEFLNQNNFDRKFKVDEERKDLKLNGIAGSGNGDVSSSSKTEDLENAGDAVINGTSRNTGNLRYLGSNSQNGALLEIKTPISTAPAGMDGELPMPDTAVKSRSTYMNSKLPAFGMGEDPPLNPDFVKSFNKSKDRRNSRATVPDAKVAKGIVSTPTSPRAQPFSPDLVSPRESKSTKPNRQLSRRPTIASPGIDEIEENSPPRNVLSVSIRSIDEISSDASNNKPAPEKTQPDKEDVAATETNNVKNDSPSQKKAALPTIEILMPQSLSQLSIETIDLICDILQEDHSTEQHVFQPPTVGRSWRRENDEYHTVLRRVSSKKTINGYPSGLKKEWHLFIQQSLYDVLSRPDALIRSFSDENGVLFDTQTIWYLMLRMTRVAPSIVFHSLWMVTESLFQPPAELEHDWTRVDSRSQKKDFKVSSADAAQIMTICLHALVAAAPFVINARQLANMSRIRSYGLLSMLGRDSSSVEPITLCLKYEDAFTDERALRLARRLFSAISARQRYAELAELNDVQPKESSSELSGTDLLQNVFGSLKFMDLGPSILDFSNSDRDLHEKRLPTLLLDWARTVMMQDWQGTAEVPRDGAFGGALALIAAIYKNRKSLLLGDIHFYSSYFSERLDSMSMPIEWLSFEPNKRTVHLLDYPYLFVPATLVTYFRSINFSRMSRSFEEARSELTFAHHRAADKQLMIDSQRRHTLYDRLRLALTRFNVLQIRRTDILTDAFNQLWRREERELVRPLKIRLGEEAGEEGSDSGGVQQEFFRLAIAEALDPDYGTFTVDQRTKMTWFQPGSLEPLWKFELIGLIFSLAVYNGLTLPVTFPKALYRKLLGEEIRELHQISDGWPDLANGLTTMLEWDEKDGSVEDIFTRTYEFSVEHFGQPISQDMAQGSYWPQFADTHNHINPSDAPLVTGSNRSDYVSDYIYWLTDVSVRPQFEAFKRGFFTCISPRSITLFTPEILQSVVEGVQEIEVGELRRYTRYVGWDASHPTIKDLWSIVRRYDAVQKRKLLEFVTASDRVPVGGLRNLVFVVQRNGVDDAHLPTSYTCYGTLLLPEYSSKEVLREKLAMALENAQGFGFA
ncbi:Ubiquitin-protein ligase E3A [Phlyctema vagabunda]|uniref:HECT-type E3 ubiquitin transferase n=1 Tax=Phlyctema vagabunda TaxID=108571 RepID=A0ABR4PEK3_9HELO